MSEHDEGARFEPRGHRIAMAPSCFSCSLRISLSPLPPAHLCCIELLSHSIPSRTTLNTARFPVFAGRRRPVGIGAGKERHRADSAMARYVPAFPFAPHSSSRLALTRSVIRHQDLVTYNCSTLRALHSKAPSFGRENAAGADRGWEGVAGEGVVTRCVPLSYSRTNPASHLYILFGIHRRR